MLEGSFKLSLSLSLLGKNEDKAHDFFPKNLLSISMVGQVNNGSSHKVIVCHIFVIYLQVKGRVQVHGLKREFLVPDWVEGAIDVFGALLVVRVLYLDIRITGAYIEIY